MKRAKIVTSAILLALCVAILGVGVYVASPTSSSVSGSIKVVSANASITVSACVNGDWEHPIISPETTRTGINKDITENILSFNVDGKNSISEVDAISITVRIQNNSKKELGAYFYKGEKTDEFPETATLSQMRKDEAGDNVLIADETTSTNFATQKFNEGEAPYKYLAPTGAQGNSVELTTTFTLNDFYGAEMTGLFDIIINVEEYQPNYTSQEAYSGAAEFVKVSSTVPLAQATSFVQPLSVNALAETQTVRTNIPQSAFANNATLKYVVIPSTVTAIGNSAFKNCTGLKTVDLRNITSIGDSAFFGCTDIAGLTVGDGTTTIGSDAFFGCSSLQTVILDSSTIANADTQMDYFLTNTSVITVYLKNTITYTGTYLANNGFNKWNVSDKTGYAMYLKVILCEVDALGVGTDYTFTLKANSTASLLRCTNASLVNAQIPEYVKDPSGKVYKVTAIADGTSSDYAFMACKSTLQTVTLPKTLTTIGVCSFYFCASITEIDLLNVTTIGDGAFASCFNLTEVDLPNVTTIGGSAFADCVDLTDINLSNVTSIGDMAFYSCMGLTDINLSNVTAIGRMAFYAPLTKVIYNKTLTDWINVSIPTNSYAFNTNTSFEVNGTELSGAITIPDGVTSIGGHFTGYTKITSVNLNDVTTIGNHAFTNCTGVTEIDLPNVTTIGNNAFFGCTGLTNVDMPKVTTIDYNAFLNCTNLIEVDVPEVTTIGVTAFRGCTSLTEVYSPNVTIIGGNAFEGCTSLIDMDLQTVTTISGKAFYNCTGLTNIDLSNVTIIGDNAFEGCTSLTEIDLPKVTTIGNYAFYCCTGLTQVTIGEDATTIGGSSTFGSCSSLQTVILDSGTIASSDTYMGYLLTNEETTTVYLKTGLSNTYLTTNGFSQSATQDKAGYVKYTK